MQPIMNFRFLPLIILSASLLPVCAIEENEMHSLDRYVARSADGRLRLEVEIYRPKKEEFEVRKNPDGYDTYYYKGKKAYPDYAQNPGAAGFITKFEFSWDGKRVEIPRRFWEDVMTPLVAVVKDVDNMPPDALREFEAHQERVGDTRPRLYISASDTGGTALIEWKRPLLHCDKSAVERWIISKKGTVIRHTFIAPSVGC